MSYPSHVGVLTNQSSIGGGFFHYIACLNSPLLGKPDMKVIMGDGLIEGQISPAPDTGSEECGKETVKSESKEV
jgi:hypothetical protein